MSAGDPLLQYGRIPGQIDIDHGIRCLEVEPRRACVRREEHPACRIALELVDQLLALLLRNGSVEPHVVEFEPFDLSFDQREHRRPFGEEHDLARFLGGEFLEQLFQPLELAGVARRALVDEIGAVRVHARQEQRFPQA
jgi:hypothetical protein